ncbi:MAG: hypothetical protein E6H89_11675 [Chloroflexi bacterium]|nr:MAG: hypothetical protein E6I49_03545 [Chloroflexota bacterium]TMG49974.1 MAG: hypothetical protein E6H89_11675 [Chloroflexota bacterium]
MFGKSLAIIALIFSFAFLILDGTDAFAAAHGGGGRKSAATGTVGLVLLNSTDGVAHWGQQVTFNVSTTATTEPHVGLKCSQSSVVVYSAQSGYYASYPWPWTQVMTLSSSAWTSGSAACIATLYYFSGTSSVTLATLSFNAYP